MINPDHLKNLIIDVLKDFDKYSEEAVDLLLLTASQESKCGYDIKQVGGGPGLGIFQMEPYTLKDIMHTYLARKPHLSENVNRFLAPVSLELNLSGNILFQIVITRVHYMRIPIKIPTRDLYETKQDYIKALAEYWKQYWNTPKGKGTIQQAIDNYNRYIKE